MGSLGRHFSNSLIRAVTQKQYRARVRREASRSSLCVIVLVVTFKRRHSALPHPAAQNMHMIFISSSLAFPVLSSELSFRDVEAFRFFLVCVSYARREIEADYALERVDSSLQYVPAMLMVFEEADFSSRYVCCIPQKFSLYFSRPFPQSSESSRSMSFRASRDVQKLEENGIYSLSYPLLSVFYIYLQKETITPRYTLLSLWHF